MNTPHKHKDVMIAAANGAIVQRKNVFDGQWFDERLPCFDEEMEYRVKPEREYPESTLTYEQLDDEYQKKGYVHKDCLLAVSRLVIKQYIIDTENK